MNRVKLGDGRWFDSDKAEAFEDRTTWDGHNYISVATGSQWIRQTLWRTRSGMWVMQTQQAYGSSYEFPFEHPYHWLIDNGHASAVPEEFLQSMEV